MEFNEAFKEAVLKVVRAFYRPNTTCQVISVDKAKNTCEVEESSGLKITKVKLISVEDDFDKKTVIYPKVGSTVTVAFLWGTKDRATVIKYGETDGGLINGDTFGGLVKITELRETVNSLKDYCEDLKAAVETGLQSVGEGGAASGNAAKAAFNLAMTGKIIEIKDMENENVKHG